MLKVPLKTSAGRFGPFHTHCDMCNALVPMRYLVVLRNATPLTMLGVCYYCAMNPKVQESRDYLS